MYKKRIHFHKKEKQPGKENNESRGKNLTAEELNDFLTQAGLGAGICPLGYTPYGFWYF